MCVCVCVCRWRCVCAFQSLMYDTISYNVGENKVHRLRWRKRNKE